jgi:hypothetical protein
MGLWALCVDIYGCFTITVTTVWASLAVKGFWALWDNIMTVTIVLLLKDVV